LGDVFCVVWPLLARPGDGDAEGVRWADVWGVSGAIVWPIEWPLNVRGVTEGCGEGVVAASTGAAAMQARAMAENA